MNRIVVAALAMLLALAGLLAPTPRNVNAQVEGNTYTSSEFGFTLTWDDSWFVFDEPVVSDTTEEFSLSNGASLVLFFAEADGIGNAQIALSSFLLGINSDPSLSDVEPLTDENGDEIRGGDATRSFAAVTYTQEIDGTPLPLGAYIETRALQVGASTLSVLHLTPRDLYETEAPLVAQLLSGLTITGQPAPEDEDESPTPSPTPVPEAAEAPQAFVSGNWRITMVAAQRGAAISAVGLEEREDKEWVVVIADITNWSGEADALAPRDIQLRFPEGAPNNVALRSTVSAAERLDIGPDDVEEAVEFEPDETNRWALVYLVDAEREGPALAMRISAPIEAVLESDVDLEGLPPVTEPPELVEAGVDIVRDGGALNVTTEPDGDETVARLLGVGAPTGDDCFADESQQELEALVGDTVFLEVVEDGTGRETPAYIWVERNNGSRILINRQLVSDGFAAYDPADNGLFASWLGESQASAQERETGLWEACAGPEGEQQTDDAEPTAEASPDEDETPTPTEDATEEAPQASTEEPTATETPAGREQGRQQEGDDEPIEDEETSSADSSAMFRGNAARTGVQPGPGLSDPATFPWQFRIGFPVISSPAVVDGVVYVGSLNSEVYALDSFSGPPKWTFLTEGEILSSPAVANGLVYIGSGDGNLYAINAETGAERWRFESGNAISSSPAVVGGVVYVASDDTFLYAVDAATGQERWQMRIGPAFSSPAVVDGVVYIGAAQSLLAIDAQSGDEIWSVPTGNFLSSSPAVANGMVYIGNDGGFVIAVDAETGDEAWRFQAEGAILSSPAVADLTVYVGSDDSFVYAIDAESGEEQWRFKTGDAVSSSPAVANDVVYIGSVDTFLYGIDAETGEELTRVQIGPILSSPAIVDGIIYVVSSDGTVHARRPFDVLGIPGLGGSEGDDEAEGTPVSDHPIDINFGQSRYIASPSSRAESRDPS